QCIAGPIFLGGEDLEILCRALGHHIAAEGSLQQSELLQSQAGDAPMGRVLDFAMLAIGRAEEADRITAVALNFEMKGKWFASDGHQTSINVMIYQDKTTICMATNEVQNGCRLSIEAVLDPNHKRRCDKKVWRAALQKKVPLDGRARRGVGFGEENYAHRRIDRPSALDGRRISGLARTRNFCRPDRWPNHHALPGQPAPWQSHELFGQACRSLCRARATGCCA